jgi:hypothetical protein
MINVCILASMITEYNLIKHKKGIQQKVIYSINKGILSFFKDAKRPLLCMFGFYIFVNFIIYFYPVYDSVSSDVSKHANNYDELEIKGFLKDYKISKVNNRTIIQLTNGKFIKVNSIVNMEKNTKIRYKNYPYSNGEFGSSNDFYNIYTVICFNTKNMFNTSTIKCVQDISEIKDLKITSEETFYYHLRK